MNSKKHFHIHNNENEQYMAFNLPTSTEKPHTARIILQLAFIVQYANVISIFSITLYCIDTVLTMRYMFRMFKKTKQLYRTEIYIAVKFFPQNLTLNLYRLIVYVKIIPAQID